MSPNFMRVLLMHPADDPACGPWNDERWDRVVDLGTAGEQSRSAWSTMFQCPVEGIPEFQIGEFAKVRAALSSGFGCVIDEHGLDWWELISIRFHEQLALVIRLQKLAAQFDLGDEVCVSRPGMHATILSLFLKRSIKCFRDRSAPLARIGQLIANALNLTFPQLIQIAGDKYDADYRIRRFAAGSRRRFSGPVVLLPVAQGNAARTALSYAAMLPDKKFLLVATRQSGLAAECGSNVSAAKLASYAEWKPSQGEFHKMLGRWREAASAAGQSPEVAILMRAGVFSGIEKWLSNGLAIRDAWLAVFRKERVSAVLCTDDTNPYTHMPLLIARQRGLPTVACHHGALDGGHLVKRSHADVVLAKGQMEKDYLINTCGLKEERIEVGAPALRLEAIGVPRHPKDSIVFFSEPYALDGGRCREFYRELLPPLVDLASQMNLKVVVKLHPMESDRERWKLVKACLSVEKQKKVEIIQGALSEELLGRAVFGLAVQSTTAIDCAIRRVPIFLCQWQSYSPYGYIEQFVRYRVGLLLSSPAAIASIPEALKNFPSSDPNDLWQTISPERLKWLLTTPMKMAVAV